MTYLLSSIELCGHSNIFSTLSSWCWNFEEQKTKRMTRTVTRTCRLSFKILATMTTMWNKTNCRFEFPSFVKWIFYYSTIFDTLTVFSYIIIIWLSSVKWHLRALRTIIFTTNFWNENNRDWLLQPAHAVMHPRATTNIIWSQ